MILVHESILWEEVTLRTEAQVVAARVDCGGSFTVSSMYFSESHNFNNDIITDIIAQLPQPFLLLGDLDRIFET